MTSITPELHKRIRTAIAKAIVLLPPGSSVLNAAAEYLTTEACLVEPLHEPLFPSGNSRYEEAVIVDATYVLRSVARACTDPDYNFHVDWFEYLEASIQLYEQQSPNA